MTRQILSTAMTSALCLSSSFVHGEQRGKPGEKPKIEKPRESGGRSKPPSGAWSESKKPTRTQSGEQSEEGELKSQEEAGAKGAAPGRNKPNKATGAEGAAAINRNKPATTGAEGAEFGTAAANRNKPATSGAERWLLVRLPQPEQAETAALNP